MPRLPDGEKFPPVGRGKGLEDPRSVEGITAQGFLLAGKLDEIREQIDTQFSAAHTGHITTSRSRIGATIRHALHDSSLEGRSALILEPSPDVPLEEIVERFDNVTLAALHPRTALRAIGELTPTDRQKIQIVHADATGALGAVTQTVNSAVEAARTSRSGLRGYHTRLSETLPYVNVKYNSPDFVNGANNGKRYDLVVSSNVLSRLTAFPGYYIGALGHDFFPDDPETGIDIKSSLQRLNIAMIGEHARLFLDSVTSNGAVYFADVAQEINTTPDGEQRSINILPQKWMSSVLGTYLESTDEKDPPSWEWNYVPGQRTYEMASHSLRLKPIAPLLPAS